MGFAIAAFLYEVLVCLVYGLLLDYNPNLGTTYDSDQILLVSILTILAIVGNSTII